MKRFCIEIFSRRKRSGPYKGRTMFAKEIGRRRRGLIKGNFFHLSEVKPFLNIFPSDGNANNLRSSLIFCQARHHISLDHFATYQKLTVFYKTLQLGVQFFLQSYSAITRLQKMSFPFYKFLNFEKAL
jgi:hypothetical protein